MNRELIQLAENIKELNSRWKPLKWQIPVGRALFYEGKKDIGAQCGRGSGKTDIAEYCSWRWAMENEGSENYIFEPLQKQAKEILWASNRIQTFGPSEWIESINNTEMRITFKNKSFIKLDGSDNDNALRGIKPKGLVIYDELKDHKKAFLDAMDPNRARWDAPALYLGTPPEMHNHYIDIMESLKTKRRGFWTRATSWDNEYNSREWLEDKKAELIARGDIDIWQREYEALFVKGSKRALFPQINSIPNPSFDEVRPKDLNKWILLASCDPGTSSVFAVVFFLWNPYSKQIIVFDELYITDMAETTSRKMWDKIQKIIHPFNKKIRDTRYIYDEAAIWFRNEISEVDENAWLEPSNKSSFGVDGYIGLVREAMAKGLVTICDTCPKLRWEMENYIKDENGRIPKANDHAINAIQYGIASTGLRFDEDMEPIKEDPDLNKRYATIEEDIDFDGHTAEID